MKSDGLDFLSSGFDWNPLFHLRSSLIANLHPAWQTGDRMNLAVLNLGWLRLEAVAS